MWGCPSAWSRNFSQCRMLLLHWYCQHMTHVIFDLLHNISFLFFLKKGDYEGEHVEHNDRKVSWYLRTHLSECQLYGSPLEVWIIWIHVKFRAQPTHLTDCLVGVANEKEQYSGSIFPNRRVRVGMLQQQGHCGRWFLRVCETPQPFLSRLLELQFLCRFYCKQVSLKLFRNKSS